MPQTRKRKVQEKNDEDIKRKSYTRAHKRRTNEKSELSEVNKSGNSLSTKIESDDDFEVSQINKNSRNKKAVTNKFSSPRKDCKLKKAKIVLHSLDLKNEHDSETLYDSLNSTDSGILSETVNTISKSETLEICVKSEVSNANNHVMFKNEPSSSESEWEEVNDNLEPNLDDYKPDIPKEGVEITIDCPELRIRKRKKKEFDENEWIRLHINRVRKDIQLAVHETHLLCLLAHGMYVNKVLNCDTIKALALSLIPSDIFSYTAGKKLGKIDIDDFEKIITWFCDSFSFESEKPLFLNLFSSMVKSFETRKSLNASEYNLMFIVIARLLGFNVRFCVSLYPVSHKATNLIKKTNNKKRSKGAESVENTKHDQKLDSVERNVEDQKLSESNKKKRNKISKKHHKMSKPKKSRKEDRVSRDEKRSTETTSRPKRSARKSYKLSSEDDDSDDKDFVEDDDSSDEDVSKFSKVTNEFQEKTPKRSTPKNPNRKILSSDSEPPSPVQSALEPKNIVCWSEVFLKPKKQWISIECVNKIINKPYDIEKLAPQPVSYIVAFDNETYVKDVTRRYCNEYMTSTIKLRVDSEWWEDTLNPFLPPNSKQNKDEEKNLNEMLINKPLPHTIQGFKNHPLYALKRHLLKFEAIYPPDAPPVGYIRSEPVYARECVCQLHSRETWLKEARVVRIGEEPYKIVKARPKWDRIAGLMKTDLPLEVFGFWQTEPYEPPVAVDGKVPRNAYGNVELFKPSMLPKGTVHLKLPGLNRVAKKLGIDCSPAVIGFDGHKGSVHAVFDGFIICEEFKDTILAAWDEEQENIRKREEEKREKRIYGNWKKLIRGLLIRERIKLKYDTK